MTMPLFVAIVLVAGLIVLLWWLRQPRPPAAGSAAEATAGQALLNWQALGLRGSEIYVLDSEHLLEVQPRGIRLRGLDGQLRREGSIDLAQPRVSLAGACALITGEGAYRYALWDSTGERYGGRSDDAIEGWTLDADGRSALILDRAETQGALRVLDAEGQTLFDWESRDTRQSGYIVAAQFTGQGRSLDALLLNSAMPEARAVVSRFSLEPEHYGTRSARFEPRANETLLWHAETATGALLAASRSSLYREGEEGLVADWSLADIDQLALAGERLAVVGRAAVDGAPRLYVAAVGEGLGEGIELPDDATGLAAAGDWAVLISGSELLSLELRQPTALTRHDLHSPILRVRLFDDGRVLVVSEDGLHRLQLP